MLGSLVHRAAIAGELPRLFGCLGGVWCVMAFGREGRETSEGHSSAGTVSCRVRRRRSARPMLSSDKHANMCNVKLCEVMSVV